MPDCSALLKYGGGILRGAATPRIDALATEGMLLLNFNVEDARFAMPVDWGKQISV